MEDVLKIENLAGDIDVVRCDKNAVDVVFPENVTRVRRQAFLDCGKLESVKLNASCRYLAEMSFKGCSALKSIEIPPSVKEIGAQAFKNCQSLPSVRIPDGCKVKRRAFEGCASLESVVIPNIKIDSNCGYSEIFDRNYVKRIEIADGVENLPQRAFKGFYALETLVLGKDVSNIGDFAFRGLRQEIKIEVRNPNFAFENGMLYNKKKKKLIRCFSKDIVVPSFIKSIGEDAFFDVESVLSTAEQTFLPYVESVSFEQGCTVNALPKLWKELCLYFHRKMDKNEMTIKKIVETVNAQVVKQKLKAEKIAKVSQMGAKSVLEAVVAESGVICEKWEDKDNQYIGVKCNRGGIELKLPNNAAGKWHEPLRELLGMIKSKDVLEVVAFAQKNKLALQGEKAERYAVVGKGGRFSDLGRNVASIVATKEFVAECDRKPDAFFVDDELPILNEIVIDAPKKAASALCNHFWFYAHNLKCVKCMDGELSRPDLFFEEGVLCACLNKDIESVVLDEGVERICADFFEDGYDNAIIGVIYRGPFENEQKGVFKNCFSLKSVKLPKSIVDIGPFTFFGCHNLFSLEFAGTVEQWKSVEKGKDWHKWCNFAVVKCTDGEAEL